MDDVYLTVRTFYFVWATILFWYMVYWGLQDIIVGRKCGHVQVPPEHNLFAFASCMASLVYALSVGEIILTDPEGGLRVFWPFLWMVPATIASLQGSYRIRMHRKAMAAGHCGGSEHRDSV